MEIHLETFPKQAVSNETGTLKLYEDTNYYFNLFCIINLKFLSFKTVIKLILHIPFRKATLF